MKKLAIYIHIPFCHSKCFYCDFCSYPNSYALRNNYVSYMKREIDLYSRVLGDEYGVETIFIGGGTPSYIEAEYIYDVLNYIYKKFNVSSLKEVTIEANPKTLDSEKLNIYKESRINRISLGLQTMNDNLLRQIGRIHTSKDFLNTYELVRKFDFNNVNVDIMFNLPNQTKEDLYNTLRETIALNVEHISLYSLKVEENTPFFELEEKGQLNLPHEDIEREMYHEAINLLQKKGYNHYEISNFAKPGFECKHNLYYWKLKSYIGIGLAAHSNINNERYGNVTDFNDYFSTLDKGILPIDCSSRDSINIEMEMAEYLILGLRLIDGVSKDSFQKRFNVSVEKIVGDKLNKLQEQKLIYIDRDRIRLTQRGIDLSNLVFIELLP